MPENKYHEDHSLIDAYNQMMARIRDSIESAEANAVPTLQKAIDHAKQKAIQLGEISLEEAEEIGNYIKRDINDAAEYLMETSHEFSEWLMLDIDIIEQKVLELFYLLPTTLALNWSNWHDPVVSCPSTAQAKLPVRVP